jgi:hypothetical protein
MDSSEQLVIYRFVEIVKLELYFVEHIGLIVRNEHFLEKLRVQSVSRSFGNAFSSAILNNYVRIVGAD